MLKPGQEILFTRQRHEATKMGLHWDYRMVVGDKAYSWATKKEMPGPGGSIVLFEQPVHDRGYALSPRVEIPAGSYGAGVTTLDWVRKAKIGEYSTPEQLTVYVGKEKYLLKKLPSSNMYGEKGWLFKNLTGNAEHEKKAEMSNKYLEKIASIHINPANKGKLHKKLGIPSGAEIPAAMLEQAKAKAKASGNVKLEREAVFAQNAKKWAKK